MINEPGGKPVVKLVIDEIGLIHLHRGETIKLEGDLLIIELTMEIDHSKIVIQADREIAQIPRTPK